MDVQIHIDEGTKILSSGGHVCGKIHIVCAQTVTVTKLTAALTGESRSLLTGAPGLLFSRREEEKHLFLREEHQIFPSVLTPRRQDARPIRLDVGCHSFDFRLRIPWVQDCSSCPPNTPTDAQFESNSTSTMTMSMHRLPPSTKDIQKGNEISYCVSVVATTIRNMFKSQIVKTRPVTIWPVDTQSGQQHGGLSLATAITTAHATILGPSSLTIQPHVQAENFSRPSLAKILIKAMFQPNFQLVRSSSGESRSSHDREVNMSLSVTKLNHHAQDLYLQSFQMLLVGYTDIRAGAATHGHMTFWTLQSLSNVGLQVFTASDISGTQREIDSRLWDGIKLDDSVVPGFATCNLERRYELEVLLGWQCQSGEHAGRMFFVQVRTPVGISSGIMPKKNTEEKCVTWSETERRLSPADNAESLFLEDDGTQSTNHAPPTYDEAVRAAVKNGLKGFETRKAGAW